MAHYRLAVVTRQRRNATAQLPRAIIAARPFLESVEAGLAKLSHLPALLLWADADIAFREQERLQWEARLPDHTTVTLAGVGHYLQSDAPAEVADAISSWWRP